MLVTQPVHRNIMVVERNTMHNGESRVKKTPFLPAPADKVEQEAYASDMFLFFAEDMDREH